MSSVLRLYLNDRIDSIKAKRTLTLNEYLKSHHSVSLNEIIDEIHSFLTEATEVDLPESPYFIEKLVLQSNSIKELPSNFVKIARNLTYLDLHDNQLTSLWGLSESCPQLEILDLSSNNFEVFPNEILLLSSLRVLSLENNHLKYLPPSVSELTHLHLLELEGNPLELPPIEMIQEILALGSDSDLIHNLKAYFVANASVITAKIEDQQSDGVGKTLDLTTVGTTTTSTTASTSASISPSNTASTISSSTTALPAIATSCGSTKSRPLMLRSKSVSDKSRVSVNASSKASRRMGLVLKQPLPDDSNDLGSSTSIQNASFYFDDSDNDLKPMALSASAAELTFNVNNNPPNQPVGTITPSSNITAGPPIVSNSTNGSPSSSFTALPHSGSSTSLTVPNLSRPNSRNRTRSNTLRDIERILDKQEITDIEQKSGAYFRRLSTLQELPQDELMMHSSNYQNSNNLSSMSSFSGPSTISSAQISMNVSPATSVSHTSTNVAPSINGGAIAASHTTPLNHSSRQHSLSHQVKIYKELHPPSIAATALSANSGSSAVSQDSSPLVVAKGGPTFEISPIKNQFTSAQNGGNTNGAKKIRDPSLTLRVSRKILFSFMELQTSIRRFTGFCVDKKLTMKMVQFLYSNKSIMETLVESLEQMEDQGNNLDQVLQSLQSSITQFKQIMELLGDNLPSFIMKTDVCFIRLLYLSLYGTFNELYNGYRALVPHHKPPVFNLSNQYQLSSVSTSFSLDPKQKAPVSESEDVDERLYRALENSINIAQVVFEDLTKALRTNPLPSPPVTGGSISEGTISTPGTGSTNGTKTRELASVCQTSMDITKRLKANLATIRNNPTSSTKRPFWDDVNLFLKSIIQFFSSVKPIMKEGSAFYEIRPSMAVLTKHTKDVTVLLEVSSYKTMLLETTNVGGVTPSTGQGPIPLNTVHSQVNLTTNSHPLQQSYPSGVNLLQYGGNNSSAASRTPLVSGMQSMLLLLQLSSEPIVSPGFTSPDSGTNIPGSNSTQ
ncbi:RAM signaling network component [Scheffersomyces spartinae]|uniref:RAM signaling network component n=1 Tax=Scheffersomyces spartinae TaxID=45513 RepID=A0A9P8AHV6_9ASCO|nr:RAM signaling network component [Scheffersomyces spartinae]KAG7192539.1 RAM signaling network component [Scheffersomyces spartinae]